MKSIFTILLSFLSLLISAQNYTVSGNAYLSDVLPTSTGHDSITIYFIDLIQQDTVATSLTDTYGAYTAAIPAGFYLIKWEKYAYIPQELGNYALSSNATLSDVTLLPGFIQNVCGTVNGTWAAGNVYHVDCDITIPSGDSLTIDPGVLVRFAAGTKLTANGKLKVLGTATDRVSFTSLSPSPLPGDWNNVVLDGPNNVINHLDYDYATNGFTGTGASGTAMDSLRMVGTLSLTANGVYLENTTNLSIDNSIISVAGSYGVYAQNANNSSITNSTIDGTYSEAAIKMASCLGCTVNNNTISNNPSRGIWMDQGFNTTITNNTMDINKDAIHVESGSYYSINDNVITINNIDQLSNNYGIYFNNSEYCTINNNEITCLNYAYDFKGIVNWNDNSQAIINGNTIDATLYDSTQCDFGNTTSEYLYAIYVYDAQEISSNTILLEQYAAYSYIIYSYQSNNYNTDLTFENNYIEYYCRYYWGSDPAVYIGTSQNYSGSILFKNNTLNLYNGAGTAVRAGSNTDLIDNTISYGERYNNCSNYNYGENLRGIDVYYDGHIIRGNTITNFAKGIELENSTDNIVDSNSIHTLSGFTYTSNGYYNWDSYDYGIYAPNSDSLFITNNTITTESGDIIYQTNGASTIKYNLLETESGRGIWCENQAGVEFSNNTIVSTNGNGDYGIHVSNLSAPIIKNNIIDNFQNGIYADNTIANYAIQYNDTWSISGTEYSGAALPPLIGNYNSTNNNGDLSDIYGNISFDPLFDANSTNPYSLLGNSPCINAGDPASPLDPDFSIADMGAYPSYDPPIFGCIDSLAFNYDSTATVSDTSCCYISGCIDSLALNYDSSACYDDGNCCYIAGCTSTNAFNYDPNACIDDGSCNYIMPGCTDSLATNYNPIANLDDGSCYYCNMSTVLTITQPSTTVSCDGFALVNATSNYPIVSYNWTNLAGTSVSTLNFAMSLCNDVYFLTVTDSAGCTNIDSIVMGTVTGCTDTAALNYNIFANLDDGSCVYPTVYGCIDSLAYNYDSLANTDDGSCLYCDLTNSFIVFDNTGGCNGLIVANAFSSNPPISYLWNNGATTNNLVGLCNGVYAVTITDDVGCVIQDTVIIGEFTYVPDDNFENYLEANGMGDGIALNDSVLTASIENVTNLDISNQGIVDLTGLENFQVLNVLDASNNAIGSIDLSTMDSLVQLRVNTCQLSALDVSMQPYLYNLTFGGNSISSIDLSNNTALTGIDCWNNNLTTLDLSNNTLLTSINCNDNQLDSIDFSNNPDMINISINSMQISSLDVSHLSNLQILWCPSNNLTQLDLSQNPLLNTLICSGNQLNQLDLRNGNTTILGQFNSTLNPNLTCINVDSVSWANSNLTNIDPQQFFDSACELLVRSYVPDDNFENYLEANGMGDGIALNDSVYTANISGVDTLLITNLSIADLTGIEDFSSLTYLLCNNNLITSSNFDLSSNLSLDFLNCSYNNLTSVDFSSNLSLSTLIIESNNLNYLDVSSNINLSGLYCANSSLDSINLNGLVSLTDFSCENNNLTDLDLSTNTNLSLLLCKENDLPALDLSNNLSLSALYCQFNLLANLDVRLNTNLIRLNCKNNGLSSLDVRNGNNINFIEFIATENISLSCISVDDSTYSTNNWLNIDSQSYFSNDCSLGGCIDPYYCNYDPSAIFDNGTCSGYYGCTDSTQFNYDPSAGCDDGSCIPFIYGCTDSLACNFNVLANTDDGSCQITYGCTDSTQFNYDPLADCDDGSCIPFVYGCLDSNAVNYDALANTDDGSCIYAGCTDSTFCNYDPQATLDDGSCSGYYGCIDPTQFNYDPLAGCDDGSCIPFIYGCTDSTSSTYNPFANTDDGSCCVDGCTDSLALNYDPLATCDDGSCIPFIYGCTDPNAINFFAGANTDDGSCIYTGCTDTLACNYDSTATLDDGSCAGYYGCTDSTQFNYDPLAGCDDGSCIPFIYGCLDSNAVNYDALANTDDGSCIYAGCTDSTFCNYDPIASLDDGSCSGYYGCTDSTALNYDPLAGCDDGSCITTIYGCTDPSSSNYNPLANVDDGSCCIDGCTDSTAFNYNYLATCDDGSCIPVVYGCTDTSAVNYNSNANTNDGSCIFAGCTDPSAWNYDSTASVDDGSCMYLCSSPKPTGLYAYDVIDTRAKIGWNNMNDSSCMVWKYFVRYREVGTGPWITKSAGVGNGLCNFGLNTVNKQLLNLNPSTTYEFKMKAFYCGGTSSNYSLPIQFTTSDVCPDMTNLAVQTFNSNQSKARFSWDTTGAYVFARILLRIDTAGANWLTAGGFGVYYPTLQVNKFGLQPGESYRAQGRTFCDSNITAYRSPTWTTPIFWTQPGNIRMNGGVSINNLDIYPNPSRDIFNISFSSENKQDLKIRILNMVGSEVYSENKEEFIGEYTKMINLNNYVKGIYFLEIETLNGVVNKKLILQ